MRLDVRVQVDFQRETLVAVLADVLPLVLIAVHTHFVLVQVAGRLERLWTLFACIISGLLVDFLMVVEITGCYEPFTTI